MARDLGLDEVVDHFTLNSEETGWLRNKTGATRLGFRGADELPALVPPVPQDAAGAAARRCRPRCPPSRRRRRRGAVAASRREAAGVRRGSPPTSLPWSPVCSGTCARSSVRCRWAVREVKSYAASCTPRPAPAGRRPRWSRVPRSPCRAAQADAHRPDRAAHRRPGRAAAQDVCILQVPGAPPGLLVPRQPSAPGRGPAAPSPTRSVRPVTAGSLAPMAVGRRVSTWLTTASATRSSAASTVFRGTEPSPRDTTSWRSATRRPSSSRPSNE